MYSLKRDVQLLKQQIMHKDTGFIHFEHDEEFNARVHTLSSSRIYEPTPTLRSLHKEIGGNTVNCVIGPYGSGKSTGLNWQALFLAASMPKCKDGVRRCKVAFVRNTYDELKQTTFELWMSWFSHLGSVKSTLKPLEIKHTFYDADGRVELHIQFLALDKIAQYRKLRSSFFTFAYINEVSESPEGIIYQVHGRTGRYPSTDTLDLSTVKRWYEREVLIDEKVEIVKLPYWSGVICDSNPPETESELFNIFEVQKPKGYQLFKQPPGLFKTKLGWAANPNAEKIERLKLDYYTKQAAGATEEYIKVFCCGEYGSLKQGQLIYENYNDNIHCVDNLEILQGVGLRLSFDTWYNPACNISQYVNGQLRVLASLWEPHCSLETFIKSYIKPYLEQYFNGLKVECVSIDPAARAGELAQGATSDYKIVCNEFGQSITKVAITNQIKARINAVEHLLKSIHKANPAILIDKQRCNILRQGFLKHYVWKETKTTHEVLYDPKKNNYSHNQDALQYEALSIVGVLDKPKPVSGVYMRPIQGGVYASI
jgi:energy-coupling factor transporter ATP-binding protein EcfA2